MLFISYKIVAKVMPNRNSGGEDARKRKLQMNIKFMRAIADELDPPRKRVDVIYIRPTSLGSYNSNILSGICVTRHSRALWIDD
jgi:hypothetical protein